MRTVLVLSPAFGPRRAALLLWLCLTLCLAWPSGALAGRVTLLIPSKPSIEEELVPVQGQRPPEKVAKKEAGKKDQPAAKKDKDAEKKAPAAGKRDKDAAAKGGRDDKDDAPKDGGPAAGDRDAAQTLEPAPGPNLTEITDQVNASIMAGVAPRVIKEEVDLLMAGMEPFRMRGYSMDPPRLFSIYRFDRSQDHPDQPAGREDRLGDIEEIRYLDQKAWGANVGLARPGLYQFTIETQPWWEPSQAGYAQHLVKTMIPVYGEDWGWHLPLRLQFEIVAEVRPFGLTAPALFAGRVFSAGQPAPGIPVKVCRINMEKAPVPTPWNENVEMVCDDDGRFSVVLNKPGWWCCLATREGAPLKGPDGQPSPLQVSALLWLYVDEAR